MDQFKDIRPYLDEEIRPVLDKLITNPEFIDSIASFYSPRLTRLLPNMMRRVAEKKLRSQLKSVNSVATMQDVIAGYMDKMIEDTTTKLTHSGIENLEKGKNYLFISNHRDITMDPAFVNYMLYHAGYETLQIAIGDNLLKKPFVSDLMRLNKSFIVRRSLKGGELLQALTHLSAYIHNCIENNHNVWIAQREGRAKDGIDKTDPALLKMLAMNQRKIPLHENLAQLHIVPVTISYEYDACDVLKANELYQLETEGSFTKTDQSDIESIVAGMIGFKGDVHVAFGKEIAPASDSPEEIAEQIDAQVLNNYQLRDSNYLALQQLMQDGILPADKFGSLVDDYQFKNSSRKIFEKRLKAVDSQLHKHLLFSYANPVIGRFQK